MKRIMGLWSSLCVLLLVASVVEAGTKVKVMALGDFVIQGDVRSFEELDHFETKLLKALTESRRFEVMSSADVKKALIEAGTDTSRWDDELARKASQLTGADYVVYGEVQLAQGSRVDATRYSITADVSIFEKGNEEIRFLDAVEIVSNSDVKHTKAYPAELLAREMVLATYPITVAENKDDSLVLNYGKDYLSKGDVLDVFTEGAAIRDPATGLVLGTGENLLGKVRVTRVKSRYSNARSISAKDIMPVGAVCRPSTGPMIPSPAPTPLVTASAAPASYTSGVIDFARVEGAGTGPGRLRLAVGDFIYGKELNLNPSSDRSRRSSTVGMTGHGGVMGELGKVLFGNPNSGKSNHRSSTSKEPDGQAGFTQKSDILREMIATRLIKTRQCDVLERSRMDEIMREVELIESGAKGLFEKDKLSEIKLKGADYLVYGTITKLSEQVHNSTKLIHSRNTVRYGMSIDMRIVDLSTGRIIASEEVSASSESVKHNANILGIVGSGRESGSGVAGLLASCAEQMAIEITTSLRPVVILDVNQESGEIIVNYGDGMIQEGAVFDVFGQGRVLRDPYSGLVVGKAESLIGRITAARVGARTCLMLPEDKKADISAYKVGMICRPGTE